MKIYSSFVILENSLFKCCLIPLFSSSRTFHLYLMSRNCLYSYIFITLMHSGYFFKTLTLLSYSTVSNLTHPLNLKYQYSSSFPFVFSWPCLTFPLSLNILNTFKHILCMKIPVSAAGRCLILFVVSAFSLIVVSFLMCFVIFPCELMFSWSQSVRILWNLGWRYISLEEICVCFCQVLQGFQYYTDCINLNSTFKDVQTCLNFHGRFLFTKGSDHIGHFVFLWDFSHLRISISFTKQKTKTNKKIPKQTRQKQKKEEQNWSSMVFLSSKSH